MGDNANRPRRIHGTGAEVAVHGAKRETVERYLAEEESRSGTLFLLEDGYSSTICYFSTTGMLMSMMLDDEPLAVGVRKHLRRIGRVYHDKQSALEALNQPRE